MRINFHTVAAFVMLMLFTLSVFAQPSSNGQKSDPDSLRTAFVDGLLGARKPGGTVIVKKTCSADKSVIPPKQPADSLDDPFNFLVKNNPDYRVLKNLEAVNLMPAKYEPAILKIQIDELFIDSDLDITAAAALYKLLSLQELQNAIDASLLNKGTSMEISIGASTPPHVGPRKVKLLSHVTVRDALNEIAIFYGSGIWEYTEYRCDGRVRSRLSFVKG